MRKFNFTNRIVSVWNNLSDFVVSLSADTVDASKIRLDRFWIDQEIRYNWKADIRIGSRSQVNVILDRYFHICVYLELNIEVLDLRSETLLLLLIRRQAPASPNFWNPSYGHMVPPRDSKFDMITNLLYLFLHHYSHATFPPINRQRISAERLFSAPTSFPSNISEASFVAIII